MTISVVICCDDDRQFDRVSRMYAGHLRGESFEILRVRDASGMAEGCNRGLAASRGEWVAFSSDGVEFLAPDFQERFQDHMQHCDVLGVAGTRWLNGPGWRMAGPPFLYGQMGFADLKAEGRFRVDFWSVPTRRVDKIQALDGTFICARRHVAESIGFDDHTFNGKHLYDVDFAYRAFLAGFKLSVACDLFPVLQSRSAYDREWLPHAQAFLTKFGSALKVRAAPQFQCVSLDVASKDDVVRAMTPPNWATPGRVKTGYDHGQ